MARKGRPSLVVCIGAFLLTAALIAQAWVVFRAVSRAAEEPVRVGEFVGMTEQEILRRLGPPTHTSDGHYGLVSPEYARQYDPVRTHKYLSDESWLYVTVYRDGDRWTCISSHRVPAGTQF